MIRLAAVLAVGLVAGGCSQSTGAGTAMTTKGYAFPPPAALTFCAKEPRLCSAQGAKLVSLTPARRSELKAVNDSVNRRIAERSDVQTSGRVDDWRLPKGEGDCEDFAILKKSELMKSGWPASALMLTVATLGGQGHTVLTVRTNEGDLVLDNRTGAIKDWSRTPYKYFARQSQSGNGQWTRIRGAAPIG